MRVVTVIVALALFDAMLSGFRAAAGRDGRVAKREYYGRAVVRGLVGGAYVIAGNAALVLGLVAAANDRHAAWTALLAAGDASASVFTAFAIGAGAAIAIWFAPIAECRVLATIIVLGPLTLIRPVVIGSGLAWAAWHSWDARVLIVAVTAGASMIGLEHWLGRAYASSWRQVRGPAA